MTSEEKKEIIFVGMNLLRNQILEAVNKAPQEWNGVEIRWLIRDKAAELAYGLYDNKKSKRYRDYKNEKIVRNL